MTTCKHSTRCVKCGNHKDDFIHRFTCVYEPSPTEGTQPSPIPVSPQVDAPHEHNLYHVDPGSDEKVCSCGYREGGVKPAESSPAEGTPEDKWIMQKAAEEDGAAVFAGKLSAVPSRVQQAVRRITERLKVIAANGEFDERDTAFVQNELWDAWDHYSIEPAAVVGSDGQVSCSEKKLIEELGESEAREAELKVEIAELKAILEDVIRRKNHYNEAYCEIDDRMEALEQSHKALLEGAVDAKGA